MILIAHALPIGRTSAEAECYRGIRVGYECYRIRLLRCRADTGGRMSGRYCCDRRIVGRGAANDVIGDEDE